MWDDRHYSFKAMTVAFFAVGLLASGCTTSAVNGLSIKPDSRGQEVLHTGSVKAADPLPARPETKQAGETKPSTAVSTSEAFRDKKPAIAAARDSAWCRYIDANSRAQSAILRSPTIAADINDEGDGGVSISYDFVDLARARIKQQTAEAQCRRFLVATKLARIMIIAPQSLTLAGNKARADYIESRRPVLSGIKQKIKAHIANGEMTVQLGTALIQHAETVASVEHRSRAQALQRRAIGKLDKDTKIGLDSELEDAERTLQEISRRSRSLDALQISVSAGYGYQGDSGIRSDSGYGKVKLSYRLGAISPTRIKYEEIAAQARVEALHEPNRGMLWRSTEMSRAVGNARSGLVAQRKQLLRAMHEARANTARYVKGYEVEMLQPRYRGQIDSIALVAEMRGIDATLIDMQRVERNLRFQ